MFCLYTDQGLDIDSLNRPPSREYVTVWMEGDELTCKTALPPAVALTLKSAIRGGFTHGTVVHENRTLFCWQMP